MVHRLKQLKLWKITNLQERWSACWAPLSFVVVCPATTLKWAEFVSQPSVWAGCVCVCSYLIAHAHVLQPSDLLASFRLEIFPALGEGSQAKRLMSHNKQSSREYLMRLVCAPFHEEHSGKFSTRYRRRSLCLQRTDHLMWKVNYTQTTTIKGTRRQINAM